MPNAFAPSELTTEARLSDEPIIGIFTQPREIPICQVVNHPTLECIFCGEVGCVSEALWEIAARSTRPEDRRRIGRTIAGDRKTGVIYIDPIPDGMRVFGCGKCNGIVYYMRDGNGYAP